MFLWFSVDSSFLVLTSSFSITLLFRFYFYPTPQRCTVLFRHLVRIVGGVRNVCVFGTIVRSSRIRSCHGRMLDHGIHVSMCYGMVPVSCLASLRIGMCDSMCLLSTTCLGGYGHLMCLVVTMIAACRWDKKGKGVVATRTETEKNGDEEGISKTFLVT